MAKTAPRTSLRAFQAPCRPRPGRTLRILFPISQVSRSRVEAA